MPQQDNRALSLLLLIVSSQFVILAGIPKPGFAFGSRIRDSVQIQDKLVSRHCEMTFKGKSDQFVIGDSLNTGDIG